jgi:hypothetical protein
MLRQLLPTCFLLTGFTLPALAVTPQSPSNRLIAQQQPTPEELYQACTQNRAETLPNPFVDVSPKDWAYKAVLTMHYCGAFRQAAPRSLFEQSRPTPATPPQSSTPTAPVNSQQ